MTTLSKLEIDILRASRGDVVHLPYGAAQAGAAARLLREGMIVNCYEDDQPTTDITDYGRAVLQAQE